MWSTILDIKISGFFQNKTHNEILGTKTIESKIEVKSDATRMTRIEMTQNKAAKHRNL